MSEALPAAVRVSVIGTGRMGAAIAAAALDRGARVTVIAANIEVSLPPGADVVEVVTTADLDAALRATTRSPDGSAGFDALVMAAAVADFRPVTRAEAKVPREEGLTLELETTPDLLAAIARIVRGQDLAGVATGEPLRPAPVLVGFAAETGGFDRAADKLRRKGVDLLVANNVAEAGSGFGTDTNRVTIFAASGPRQELPLQSKRAVADRLLDRVARLLDERDAAAQTDATTEPEREPA